tara:strand:+ start:523 stop:681 length:159 start_codon:yes stop_codon:yes gene_type:complete
LIESGFEERAEMGESIKTRIWEVFLGVSALDRVLIERCTRPLKTVLDEVDNA